MRQGDDLFRLLFGKPVLQAYGDVRLQLRFGLGPGRQGGYGHQFAGSPVKVVAGENVAKEMGFQIFVQLGMEVEKLALDRAAAEFRLVFRSENEAFAFGKRAGRSSFLNRLAGGGFFLSQNHERLRRVERPGETAVGVKLTDDLLGLVQGQAFFESRFEIRSQFILFAARQRGADIR